MCYRHDDALLLLLAPLAVVSVGEGDFSGCVHTEGLGIVGEDDVKAFSFHGLNLPVEDGWEISH